jgi:hypothetical protein
MSSAAAMRLPLDIEARPPTADQFLLAQQRGELAGRMLPNDGLSLFEDAPGLGIAAPPAKIAQ